MFLGIIQRKLCINKFIQEILYNEKTLFDLLPIQGVKCKYSLCKTCCKSKCYTDNLNCEGHGIMIQLRRQYAQEKARATENGEKVEKVENVKTDVLA